MRKTFFIGLLLVVSVVMTAQTVTQEKARQKAVEFMRLAGMDTRQVSRKTVAADGAASATPPYYIFNAAHDDGFVVVSGDERTPSILGYVAQATFDEKTMPDNMRAWLNGYAREIRRLQEGKTCSQPLKVSSHARIHPLLKTKWDQGVADAEGDAYNMNCPQIGGVYCLTGCVATAMAQVMRYHQWPQTFSTEVPAYKSNTTIGSLDALPAMQFDWDNMRYSYQGNDATDTEKNAVASLMRYCGQSVEMNYGTGGSGATTDFVARALRNYFGYDINTRYVMRCDYTAASWDELIYDELAHQRPVVYNGSSTGGGHAFVCDGYDGNGFYHINWGWGGFLNGYFRLSVLNPDGGGAGSSGTKDGYSMDQGAVVGIQAPTGNEEEMRMLTLDNFYASGTSLYAKYTNRTGLKGVFEYGFAYQRVGDESGTFNLSKSKSTIDALYVYTAYVDVAKLKLSDGVYRFYPYSRLVDGDWYRVAGDFETYIEVTVSGGEVASVVKHPQPQLSIESLECVSSKVVSLPQEIKATVSNAGEEFNGLLYLFASKRKSDKGTFVNKTGLVVEAGATEEASLYFTPSTSGTWYVWVSTDERGQDVVRQTQVEIRSMPTTPTALEEVACQIQAHPTTHIQLTVKNMGDDGYFMPVMCYLFPPNGGNSLCGNVSGHLNLGKGETGTVSFDFDGLVVGEEYMAAFLYYTDHQSGETGWFDGYHLFTVEADILRGDANTDGVVDISDVLTTVDFILGKDVAVFDHDRADVITDGMIDISDVLEIVNIILGK